MSQTRCLSESELAEIRIILEKPEGQRSSEEKIILLQYSEHIKHCSTCWNKL